MPGSLTDPPYSNRELREKWKDMEESLNKILFQTTTTNGRVSRLENWRAFITGGMAVITVILIPILTWALYVLANIQGQGHSAVDDALSAYTLTQE